MFDRLVCNGWLAKLALTAALGAAAGLAGCGGQGAGAGGGAQAGGTSASIVEIISEKSALKSSGADQTALQILVKDSGNRPVVGQQVVLQADSGLVVADAATTNAQGVVTGKLSITAGDRSNRTIKLSASAGSLKSDISIAVTGTKLTATIDKSALVIGEAATFSASVEDDLGLPLINEEVTFVSKAGNPVPASGRTDSKGKVVVTFAVTKAGADSIAVDAPRVRPSPSGLITLQVADPTATETLQVTGAPTISIDPPVVAQRLTVKLRRPNGDVANKVLKVTTTRGSIVDPGVPFATNAQGIVLVDLLPGSSVGQVLVTAEAINPASGLYDGKGLKGQYNGAFITSLPAGFDIQTNPNVVSVNRPGGGTQRSEIRVRVYDATVNRNPVTNAFVRFRLVNDPSGGSLLSGGTSTNVDGFATTTYIVGERESGTDEVVVEATVEGVAAAKTAKLTVAGSPLFVSIGSGNTLTDTGDATTYQKDFNVRVTDSAGVAVKDVPITVRLLPQFYVKGRHLWNGLRWANASSFRICPNEDKNFDGTINAGLGEDSNNDGRLFPGQVAAARPRLNESVRTDDNGSVKVTITYARSWAYWAQFEIEVSAQVGGSQGRASEEFLLIGATGDFTAQDTSPPGEFSAYGIDTTNCSPN